MTSHIPAVRHGLAAVAAILLAATCVPALAQNPPVGTRVETPIDSMADTPGVVETLVSLYEPLPASVGAHPAACDWNSYVRYRDVDGPADSSSADAIFATQSGFGGGPSEVDILARNLVMRSAASGKHAETWVQVHRWNCLIDRTGLDAAVTAKDYHVAIDYYYNHRAINGKTYQAPTWAQQHFLTNYSLDRFLTDWYDIMVQAIPDPAVRQRKIFCGGHSYGSVVTSVFAGWGFGSHPANPANAGYNQCAAFWGVDAVVTTDVADLANKPVLGSVAGVVADAIQNTVNTITTDTGLVPTLAVGEVPVFYGLEIIALAAYLEPQQETDLLKILPAKNPILGAFLWASLSRTYQQFLTNTPDYRSFRYTNEALLGTMFDNNTNVVGLDALGLGTLGGGPVGPKNFPYPPALDGLDNIPVFGPMLGSYVPGLFTKVGPTDPTVLYTWNDYKTPPSTYPDGTSYTKSEYKMTDIHQWARTLFEGPGAWVEAYYPLNLIVGLGASLAESHTPSAADKHLLYPQGIASKPRFVVFGTSGFVYTSLNTADVFLPLIGAPPLDLPNSLTVPWYSHYDMSTGAYLQNDGSPERVSQAVSDFVIQRIGN
ncbi:MAG: hypothetical protein P4L83_25570 [Nevskia sp.]|nr:hypothetical protein [Nevskia sp.]